MELSQPACIWLKLNHLLNVRIKVGFKFVSPRMYKSKTLCVPIIIGVIDYSTTLMVRFMVMVRVRVRISECNLTLTTLSASFVYIKYILK